MATTTQQLRPDAKGRINLGRLAQGVSSFAVSIQEDGSILLEPFAEIPAREKWVFENPEVMELLTTGLKQAALGNSRSLGDFSQFADDEIE